MAKKIVTAFGRMNPPTIGHEKLINHIKALADAEGADHEIRVSHSQDAKKNPLSAQQKLHHLGKMFPDTKFSASSKEAPSFIHHLKNLHNKGYTHVKFVAGSDRVPEYKKIVDKYNKPEKEGGEFHFKHIEVVSAGHRDPDAEGTEGMSASKMREHAREGNYHSFKSGLPKHVSHNDAQALYNDVRKGMGIHESVLVRFKNWLMESTNASAGAGIRGFGDVSGQPAGDISNYAATNASTPPQAQGMVDQHNSMHVGIATVQAGMEADTKDNVLKKKK